MRHPFLQPLSHFYVYLGIWAFLTGAHTALLVYVYDNQIGAALADAFIFNFMMSIFCLGIWYAVRFVNIDTNSFSKILLSHITAITAFLFFWTCTGQLMLKSMFFQDESYISFLKSFLALRFFTGTLYYMIAVLFYYLYIYYHSFQEKQLKEVTLQKLVKETQLELLKSQLNPHFIFNSLNSVSALTISNPGRAQEMVIKLSSFLRNSLGHKNTGVVSLKKEMENSLLYLEIEQVRFGDRLTFVNEMDDTCLEVPVPDMILQPLLENAVKHGVYESSGQVFIRMKCKAADGVCSLVITNNFSHDNFPRAGKGMGINNVRERLLLLYGQHAQLKTQMSDHLFTATLNIPYSND